MTISPDRLKPAVSCSDMSPGKALDQIKELGFESLQEVPTGPGRDYLSTLVLIARGYYFGGLSFENARMKLHNTDWNREDIETREKKRILELGRFERFTK